MHVIIRCFDISPVDDLSHKTHSSKRFESCNATDSSARIKVK